MSKVLANSFTDKEREMFAGMRVCIVSPIVYIEPQWTRSTVNAVAYAWSQGLRVEDMGIAYWSRRFDGARRVPVETNASTAP